MNEILTYSFCDRYIDKLAGFIDNHYIKQGKDLSRLAICFGGKRPALFIKRELSRRIGGSFYPPRFFTIDEFVGYCLGKKEVVSGLLDLDNCYLLYQLAKTITPQVCKGRESFSQFLPWTREIIKFIDNLDLENIDNERLKNIEKNAQIGYAVPEDINELLKAIVVLREAYHAKLLKNKQYSRGLQYLKASEMIEDLSFDEFDQILFCNFFYFNQTEQILIKALYRQKKATLIFQGDQRKWPVLERISKNFACTITEGEKPEIPRFKLKLYSGFDGHSQMGLVRRILQKSDSLAETVIVLPNAESIVGLMSEISSELTEFNISMGYPLKRSSLYSLLEFVFRAQRSKRKDLYYAKDYLKVLKHPFIKNLNICQDETVSRILIHKIEEVLTGKEVTDLSGSLFIDLRQVEHCDGVFQLASEMLNRFGVNVSAEDLTHVLQVIHRHAFGQWEEVHHFCEFAACLNDFLTLLRDKSFLSKLHLNALIAEKMFILQEEFAQAAFSQEAFAIEEIFKIFDSKVSREMVKFKGSPLKGLQILGLMETRALNFKNVIILDVNEGVLPHLNIYEPLIPREVMISLNLDRLEMEEEIQRYQFMRLISSAENVHLIYQKSKDKERSRFIEELVWEEQKANQKYRTEDVLHGCFQVKVSNRKKVIPKTSAMLEVLRKHTYSASSINTYLRNPLEFYYSYVLGLREKEDLLDEPEAKRVGTFFHELLEEAFQSFLHKKPVIDSAFRKYVLGLFETRFGATFGRGMKSDAFLLKSVMEERIKRFLDNEETNPQRQVKELLHLEKRFEDVIALSCGDIKFSYIVDRVDQLADDTVMIIDYKTGSVGQMPKAIDRIKGMDLSRETIKEEVKSFQIPLYFNFLNREYKSQKINAALYNLRTMKLETFIDSRMSFARAEIQEAFLKPLDFILSEILNPEIDFVEDTNE